MKRTIATLLALVMVLSLTACGGKTNTVNSDEETEAVTESANESDSNEKTETAEGTDVIEVALSTFSLAIPWQIQTIDLLQEAVDGYDGKVNLTVANADNNTANQITQIENFIDQGVDILLVDASSSTGLNPTLQEAKDAGIVVVNYNCTVDDPECVSARVFVDQTEWGRIMARFIVEELDGKGDIVCLTGLSGNQIASDRWTGAQEVFAENPDINILAEAPAEWEQSPAEEKMQAWITAFPNIDAVWADGGPCGVGVINVLEKNDMDMIPVSGEASYGFVNKWYSNVENGLSGCAPCCPVYIGAIALEAAMRIYNGEAVDTDIALEMPVMTNENIGKWADESKSDEDFAFDKITAEEIAAIFN